MAQSDENPSLVPPFRILLVTALLLSCGGLGRRERPVADFATTLESQVSYARVEEAFHDYWDRRRERPSPPMDVFAAHLAQFAEDGRSARVRVLYACLFLEQGRVAEATAQLEKLRDLPLGTTRDLHTVVSAKVALVRGDPNGALDLLRPLVGKNVDPLARALFDEALVVASVNAEKEYEAIAYMDMWLGDARGKEREVTRKNVADLLGKAPRRVLEETLGIMRREGEASGYSAEIKKLIVDRLSEIAVVEDDAELARMILDPKERTVLTRQDLSERLSELATSRRGMNIVEGRTLGLLLPIASPSLRDEAASVLRGVMWALGMPEGIRQVPKGPSGPLATARHCGGVTPLLVPEEPGVRDGIRLVTRDDTGKPNEVEASLEELMGQGVGALIASLDAESADRVLAWGERRGVPVILLAHPRAGRPKSYGFVMGESLGLVLTALARDVEPLTFGKVVPLVDESEMHLYPQEGGAVGPVHFAKPVSCDALPLRAGGPRFPLAQWEKEGLRTLSLSGTPACARDLFRDLTSMPPSRGLSVALHLEAATVLPKVPGVRVFSAACGIVPLVAVGSDDEVLRFVGAFGRELDFWTALGRDAAGLARLALRTLPEDATSDRFETARRRQRVRQALLDAKLPLWTSEAIGFSGKQKVERTVCTVPVSE